MAPPDRRVLLHQRLYGRRSHSIFLPELRIWTVSLADLLYPIRSHGCASDPDKDPVMEKDGRLPPQSNGGSVVQASKNLSNPEPNLRIFIAGALAGSALWFIQESFAPVYHDCGERWIDENTPIRTARFNRTIEDAEAAAERFARAGRVGTVLRFALFYGPGDAFTLDTINLIRRGWMPVLGSPDAFVSLISHEDAAAAVVGALGVPAGIYNVVDDQPLRRREFAQAIAGMLGVRPPNFLAVWVPTLTGSLGEMIARSLRISNRKLRQASGWSPRYPSAREGWRAIVESTDRR